MRPSNTTLTGLGASRGIVTGRARLVLTPADRAAFQDSEILVTRITDPSMVSLMAKAAAIVCDIGGMVSHPSIVSRELGIPCVVATRDGTAVLRTGMLLSVDGERGEVTVLEDGP